MSVLSPVATFSPALLPVAKTLVSRWKARCVTFLCLAAFAGAGAPDVHAQMTGNLTTIGYFNGANGIGSNQALAIGSDGNLYGAAPGGGPNTLGTFYQVAYNGTIKLIYRFGDSSEVLSPTSSPLLVKDGSFYGTASALDTDTNTLNEAVYRVTTSGIFGVVHTFAKNGTTGTGLVPGLVQGNDGALYGVTQIGGNLTAANPDGDGTIFRLTPDGNFTTLYRFDFNETSVDGSKPNVPLVLGSDGNFYGVTLLGGTYGIGSIYKLAVDGTVTIIHSFNGQEGNNAAGALVEGERGIFYGLTTSGGSLGYGTFFNVTVNGVVNVLHNFTASELPSIQQTNQQSIPQSGLIKASNGNFYLTVQASGTTADHILQLTPTGIVTTIFQFTSTTEGSTLAGALVQARDGNFYGTTVEGGVVGYNTPSEGAGTVFRLTLVQPVPLKSFFDGQVALSNGVYYLSFPNGNFFGYYAYLTDPRYIYHFDLGYEYIFDANDGVGGVYFYDFRSEHFFYTSPTFPFPYLYDFTLNAVLYYYPNANNPGRYNINGLRYFYNFATKRVITQ